MYGIDLSNHQRGINLEEVNFDFAIIKATEGINFKDPMFEKFASQLTRMNKLIGCYHFARPDNRKTENEIIEEAKWFLSVVKEAGLIGKAILCLDWETAPYNASMAQKWLDYVRDNTVATPFIYGSYSVLSSFIKEGLRPEYKIWMAKWPSIEKFLAGSNPGLTLPSKAKVPYDIWQYTSNGFTPNYNGRIDLDYTSLTSEAWRLLANTSAPQVDTLTDDMKWAIEMGIFKGYPDGSFKPYQPVTRSQLATILHRLYKEKLLNQVVGTEHNYEQ